MWGAATFVKCIYLCSILGSNFGTWYMMGEKSGDAPVTFEVRITSRALAEDLCEFFRLSKILLLERT
jgi:hypothetical protein